MILSLAFNSVCGCVSLCVNVYRINWLTNMVSVIHIEIFLCVSFLKIKIQLRDHINRIEISKLNSQSYVPNVSSSICVKISLNLLFIFRHSTYMKNIPIYMHYVWLNVSVCVFVYIFLFNIIEFIYLYMPRCFILYLFSGSFLLFCLSKYYHTLCASASIGCTVLFSELYCIIIILYMRIFHDKLAKTGRNCSKCCIS